MNIIVPGEESVNPIHKKEEIIAWINDNLWNSLNLGNILKEYNDIAPTLVQVRNLRDSKEYTAEEILSKIIEEAKKYWYADLKLTEKKIDQNWNIISIWLKGHSNNHGDYIWNSYFWFINFNRACTYWEKSCRDETSIYEESFDSEEDDIPMGGDIIYRY